MSPPVSQPEGGKAPAAEVASLSGWAAFRHRLRQRRPDLRRTLRRDLALLLLCFVVTRHVGVAWVLTDSVHRSALLVLKGAAVHPGDLVVFAYGGKAIEGYYAESSWSRMLRAWGVEVPLAGPRRGEGFVKILKGLPGDRVEVQGQQVWLVHPGGGREHLGEWKPRSRRGVPLQPIASQVIPPGQVYVWAPHPDALDSRYAAVGLVSQRSIVGRGVALW